MKNRIHYGHPADGWIEVYYGHGQFGQDPMTRIARLRPGSHITDRMRQWMQSKYEQTMIPLTPDEIDALLLGAFFLDDGAAPR